MQLEILGPLRVTDAAPVKASGQRRRLPLGALLAHAGCCGGNGGLAGWRGARRAPGRHADVVPELTRLVAKHPLHEPFYVLLMIALFRCGRRADALAVYRRARNVLAREVQVAPGPDLRRTEAAILAGELD